MPRMTYGEWPAIVRDPRRSCYHPSGRHLILARKIQIWSGMGENFEVATADGNIRKLYGNSARISLFHSSVRSRSLPHPSSPMLDAVPPSGSIEELRS